MASIRYGWDIRDDRGEVQVRTPLAICAYVDTDSLTLLKTPIV